MMRFGRVEVTGGFFLLAAWLNYLDQNFLLPAAVLACGAHELGHYWVIKILGGDIKVIRLTAVGAEMILARPLSYWQEGISALAGPGINLLLALAACGWTECYTFAGLNLVLAFFNLMPVSRLDGGRALYCTLALLAGQTAAGQAGYWLDCLLTGTILSAGLLLMRQRGNITLLLIGLWLLAVFAKQNFSLYHRNSTCQRDRKKVQ